MRARSELTDAVYRWPFVAAKLAVTSLSLGCQPDANDRESFRIVSVSFDGASTLTLTFSEPIVDVGKFDPNDFRISVGFTYRTTYDGPAGASFTEQGTRYTDVGEYIDTYTRLGWTSATLGANDKQLMLQAEQVFGDVCGEIAYYIGQFERYQNSIYTNGVAEMGMFLHYAVGDIPIQNESGDTIADIGRDWVLSDNMYEVFFDTFGFPDLTPKLEVMCP
jgi:hypothetical protein